MTESLVELELTQIPKIANGYRLQYEEAQEGWVMLYPEILKRCDGETSIEALIKKLEDAFDASGLEDDVKSFLKIALEQHWILLD